jgi:hypothetical protein
MTDTSRSGGDEERPDPAKASTPAEFVDAMLRLKQWTGWGFRRLEKRAAAAGHLLPRSTLTAALTRQTLPREDLVTALTMACGCDETETAQWIAARRRIAAAPVPPNPQPPTTPRVAPATQRPASSRPHRKRWRTPRPGRQARRIIALAVTLLAVAAVIGYVLPPPDNPGVPRRAPDQAAPARPGPSLPQPTQPAPESSTPTPEPTSAATTASPTAVTPAAEVVPQPAPAQPPAPGTPSSTPTSVMPPPPAQEAVDREVIRLPGEPTIYCPRPYLNTLYAALAQCTQLSASQARAGRYSPLLEQFSPITDWLPVQDQKWYDAFVLATDGVWAFARGYTIVKTEDGAAVFATQYRDGEARWGIMNMVDHRFHPGSPGWQPIGH